MRNVLVALMLCGVLLAGPGCEPEAVHNVKIVQEAEQKASLYVRVAFIHEGQHPGFYVSRQALAQGAHTFKNRMVLLGHEHKDPNKTVGRIVDCKLKKNESGRYYLEGIVEIMDREAIEKIKRGLYYYVSVGMSEVQQSPITGHIVRMKGIELSFVGAPRDRDARVLEYSTKRLSLNKAMAGTGDKEKKTNGNEKASSREG